MMLYEKPYYILMTICDSRTKSVFTSFATFICWGFIEISSQQI